MMRLEAVLHNMLFVIAGYCSNMIRSTKQRICKARGMISHDVGKGPYDEYSLYSGFSPSVRAQHTPNFADN
jgi:hypothetical protein